MLEDKVLIWKLKSGDKQALVLIYEKYKHDMLCIAGALCDDSQTCEDAVHDVFVNFARNCRQMKISYLKGYLLTCVANRIKDFRRNKNNRYLSLDEFEMDFKAPDNKPDTGVLDTELSEKIKKAMTDLPDEQKDVILMRIGHNMKFRQIAETMCISANTARSRYRYGIEKLQAIMNREVYYET